MDNKDNFNFESLYDNSENEDNAEILDGRESVRRAELRRLKREKAKRRRNTFIALVVIIAVLIIGIIGFVIFALVSNNDNKNESSVKSDSSENSSVISSVESSSSDDSSVSSSSVAEPSEVVSSEESKVESTEESSSDKPSDTSSKDSSSANSSVSSKNENKVKLDPEFSNLLLVNGKSPLPEDYDYTGNLAIIEDKYLCGYRNQMDADVMPYATAMVEAAWDDGVDLYILSPYRSYDTQKVLYENEVKKWMNTGMERKAAEDKATTVVARPGTSEHHTGMAIDFNSVEHSFEKTDEYKWLSENAQNYGFILRYTEEKQPITGVIHESWHWRFVGINEAKKIKASGLCLEEYLQQNQ